MRGADGDGWQRICPGRAGLCVCPFVRVQALCRSIEINDGTYGVFPANHVAVVKTADQETSKLTEGIVAEVLTKSVSHPRGIKVRLEDGTIGRVQSLLK